MLGFCTRLSIWQEKYIKTDRFPFMMLMTVNKEEIKFDFKEVIVYSVEIFDTNKNDLIDICLLQIMLRIL